MFSLRGLKSERGQGSLRDPFRSALEPAQEKRGMEPLKRFASKHLTNGPVWFILQGCQRNGTKSCLTIEIEIDGCARRDL